MNTGLGVFLGPDGKHYVSLVVSEGAVNIHVTVTNEDNYEHDIDELIRGLKGIKADMRQVKSGLQIVKEVPNGFRSTQGRGQLRSGS